MRGGKCYCYFTCVTGGHSFFFFFENPLKMFDLSGRGSSECETATVVAAEEMRNFFRTLFSFQRPQPSLPLPVSRFIQQSRSTSTVFLPCKLVQTVGWTNAKHALNVTQ